MNKKTIKFLLIPLVLLILITIIYPFYDKYDKSEQNKLIKKYIYCNKEEMVGLLPESVLDAALEVNGFESKDDLYEIIDEYNDLFSDMYFSFEFGSKDYTDYEISNCINYSRSDLKGLEEFYRKEYDLDININAAKDIILSLEYEIDGSIHFCESELSIIKVGFKWYLDISSVNFL